ncbi:uncharacterized protein CC84DRAFT_1180565 [Paraphaeosphaeria sporulosa]|uniref:Uncharacterized protein n=1 Tax=Paraphaeosphaeria sporulosa TaxID=1460663 RepID=A0A177BZB5_9PLEO|nr:uncharacterized protein CC84DRAFT_1180565 [Paraphaeosphaeria sporulosa]OAG00565.1 hypothetical protein CC84DRAFT_1180565 [Paraphaeosphaeria sporulosa]
MSTTAYIRRGEKQQRQSACQKYKDQAQEDLAGYEKLEKNITDNYNEEIEGGAEASEYEESSIQDHDAEGTAPISVYDSWMTLNPSQSIERLYQHPNPSIYHFAVMSNEGKLTGATIYIYSPPYAEIQAWVVPSSQSSNPNGRRIGTAPLQYGSL